MRRRKIAFVTPIYLPANLYGSDRAVRILAQALVGQGADVSIITSNAMTPRYWYDPIFGKKIANSCSIHGGVKVHRLACNHITSISSFIASRMYKGLQITANGPTLVGLKELLEREKFDVVHSSPFPLHINKQVVDSVKYLAKRPRIIFTPFFHSLVPSYHNEQLNDLFSQADKIHAVSNAEKEDIEKEYPGACNKTVVIPLFLPKKELRTITNIQKDCHAFRVSHALSDRIVIVFAGIKGTMKGALNVLSAVARLYRKDRRYILIAIGHNTTEWNNDTLHVNPDMLINYGYVDEATKEIIIGAADMVCIPSKSESFGFVYLEAWAKKKPIIAADIPAVRELVNDAGILVPYNDINHLIEAIEKLGYNDRLRKRVSEKGFYRFNTYYTDSKVMKNYTKLFYG